MAKPLSTEEIEFAYEVNSVIAPNIDISEISEVDGEQVITRGYKTRLSINYELQDVEHKQIGFRAVEHWSDFSKTRLTAEQVTEWVANNRNSFILADKKQLSGYGE